METSQTPSNNGIAHADTVVFALFCALVSTLCGYLYGRYDHIEQLPIILRTLDCTYLANDFFTNAASGFGPRFYYAHFIAGISSFIPLPATFFALTLFVNSAVSVTSYSVARVLFNDSKSAGILAIMIVMSVSTVQAGSVDTMFAQMLTPSRLAFPLVLMAFLAALRNHAVLTGMLAGIASIIHPVFGLGSGAILLGSLFLLHILERRKTFSDYATIMLGSGIALLFSLAFLIPYGASMGEHISTEEFIHIVAYFRHPHHFIPSHILAGKSLWQIVAFIGASCTAWYLWRKTPGSDKTLTNYVFIIFIVLFYLCIGGTVFVEIIPTRIWTVAQTFRFLNLFKWLSLILFAGVIAQVLAENKGTARGYLLVVSLLTPFTALIAFCARPLKSFCQRVSPGAAFLLSTGPLLVLIAVLLRWTGSATNPLLFLIYFFLAVTIIKQQRKIFYPATALLFLYLCVTILPFPSNDTKPWDVADLFERYRPHVTLSDYSGDKADLARYVRKNTEKEAVFVAPPTFGILRLIGERALVVDYKAFPFQDQAAREWLRRIIDCYGIPKTTGYAAAGELDFNYHHIPDDVVRNLGSKYTASYAILYKETETTLPVVYENKTYKLVAIPEEKIEGETG